MTTLTQQIKADYYMSLIIYVYIYIMESPSLKCSKNMWNGTWGHGLVVNMTVLV